MAILAVVLVPLFLLIPMLAKYAHTRQVTQQAARAAAWEATVVNGYHWGTLNDAAWRERQRQLIIDRHFGDPEAPIWSESEQTQPGDRVAAVMMNTFSDQPLLTREDIVLDAYGNESGGHLTGLLEGAGSVLESLPGEFPPNRDGLVTARMTVSPQNLKTGDGGAASFLAPFDQIDLQMESQHALLADAWGASGNGLPGADAGTTHRKNRSVKEQVRTLVPFAYFDEATGDKLTAALEKFEFMGKVPLIGTPFLMKPGYIQPDIVPHDRLQKYEP